MFFLVLVRSTVIVDQIDTKCTQNCRSTAYNTPKGAHNVLTVCTESIRDIISDQKCLQRTLPRKILRLNPSNHTDQQIPPLNNIHRLSSYARILSIRSFPLLLIAEQDSTFRVTVTDGIHVLIRVSIQCGLLILLQLIPLQNTKELYITWSR